MTMAMNMTVFAAATPTATPDPKYKLTLTGTAEGHIYGAYQIFTGDLSEDASGKVLSNVEWGSGVTYNGTDSAAAEAAKLTNEDALNNLMTKLTLTTPVKTVKSSKDSTEISDLAAGYYLVKDQDGTQAGKSDAYTKFIVQVVGDTTAAVKSAVPTVEKKVMDTNDSTGETSNKWQDSADYDIGDDVPFQITGTMPSRIDDYTTYKYVFTDNMSKGLTYTAGKATIKIGNKDVTTSFTEHVTTTDDSTVVTWTCDDLKGIDGVTLNKDTEVVVTYSAKLNENAVTGSAGNPNTVNLTYSNNPNKGGEGETGKTPEDKNIVFTYKTVVNKVDQSGSSLKGAAFKLEKKVKTADGITMQLVKEFTAGEVTTFTFTGLDDGDYRLTETTTPSGYNTIAPVEFTISATHEETSDDPKLTDLSVTRANGFKADTEKGSLTTDIVNQKGSNLPSTGGVGTRMFYVFGGCLVAAAAVLLALKKRREA